MSGHNTVLLCGFASSFQKPWSVSPFVSCSLRPFVLSLSACLLVQGTSNFFFSPEWCSVWDTKCRPDLKVEVELKRLSGMLQMPNGSGGIRWLDDVVCNRSVDAILIIPRWGKKPSLSVRHLPEWDFFFGGCSSLKCQHPASAFILLCKTI